MKLYKSLNSLLFLQKKVLCKNPSHSLLAFHFQNYRLVSRRISFLNDKIVFVHEKSIPVFELNLHEMNSHVGSERLTSKRDQIYHPAHELAWV